MSVSAACSCWTTGGLVGQSMRLRLLHPNPTLHRLDNSQRRSLATSRGTRHRPAKLDLHPAADIRDRTSAFSDFRRLYPPVRTFKMVVPKDRTCRVARGNLTPRTGSPEAVNHAARDLEAWPSPRPPPEGRYVTALFAIPRGYLGRMGFSEGTGQTTGSSRAGIRPPKPRRSAITRWAPPGWSTTIAIT